LSIRCGRENEKVETYRKSFVRIMRSRRNLIRWRKVRNERGRRGERGSWPRFQRGRQRGGRDEAGVGIVDGNRGEFEMRSRVRLMRRGLLGREERLEGYLLLPVLFEASLHRRWLLLLLLESGRRVKRELLRRTAGVELIRQRR
jgi:hypothetical protein